MTLCIVSGCIQHWSCVSIFDRLFYQDDYCVVMGVLFGFLLSRLSLGYI